MTAVTANHEEATVRVQAPEMSRRDWLWIAGLVVVLSVLYAWQLQPGIAPHGDISKFQFAGPLGGTVHQTGYPLYLMITWLAAKAPIVDAATAATAVSAVSMVGAAAMAYVSLRELQVRPVVAAGFGFVLGVAPFVFYFAVVAEVYALNLFLVSALLASLLRWRRTGSDAVLGLAMALLAASFAHHMTTVFLVPGVLVLVWLVDRTTFRRPGVWLFGLGALAVAALSYGYLIWRAGDPATPFIEVAPESWRDLPAIWRGGGAAGSVNFDPASMFGDRLPTVARNVIRTTVLVLPLSIAGFRALWRDAAGWMLGLWAAGSLLFALVFRFPDVAGFLIPVVFVIVVAAGVGAEWVAVRYLTSGPVAAAALATVVVAALIIGIGFVNVQSHDEYDAKARSWLAELPEDSVLAAGYTDAMAAFYVALLEEERTDVVTVSDYPLADPHGSVIGRYLAGETVEVPHTRERLQPGRTVYAPGQAWACDLAEAGFGIKRYSEQLFQVLALEVGTTAAEHTALCEPADA